MRIMRSRQPALPAPPHPLMRVAAATSASPRRPGCTRLYFPRPRAVRASRSRRSNLQSAIFSTRAILSSELTAASSSSWTPSTSEILLGGVLDHLRDGGVATFRIGACAAQIRRIHGEILASNFHRGSSKLPISAMTFLAVVERAVLLSLSVGAKSSSARGGAVAAHILVP